jgi:hypothetical protein
LHGYAHVEIAAKALIGKARTKYNSIAVVVTGPGIDDEFILVSTARLNDLAGTIIDAQVVFV